MCDLNQLEQAIQEMATNEEAARFVNQVLEEDNIQFLRYITQIWLNPKSSDKIMTNGVTLITVALRPTVLQPITLLAEKFFTLSEEERDQIKNAIIRGLMHDDSQTRANFAYCLSFIFKIERTYEDKISPRFWVKPTIFDTHIVNLLNSESKYAKIGGIMAITEILANEAINTRNRKFIKLPQIILEISYQAFGNMDDVDEVNLEFKSECAKCINQGFKSDIFRRILAKPEEKTRFLQSLLPNVQIPFAQLHKNLLNALKQFICMLYDQYSISFSAEEITPFIQQIYEDTIQPVATIQTEEFDLNKTEPFARDVIRMWKKFANKEYEINQSIDDEFHLNIISTIAPKMDEYLFSFISTYQIEDIEDNDHSNPISFFSYQCLLSFSTVAPKIVFEHANSVYESCLQTESRQSFFVSSVAAQILFQIKEVPNEVLYKIFNDMLKYTQNVDELIVTSAYNVLITVFRCHCNFCTDSNYFKCIFEAISSSLQSESTIIVLRALKAFESLISPYKQNDEDSNLSECYQSVIKMLMGVSQRSDVKLNLRLEREIYFAIYKFLSKLPLSVPDSLVLSFGSQIYDQMQSLVDEHGDLQLRAFLSIIVNGVTEKVESEIESLAPGFLTILTQTCEEINSTNANIYSHDDVIAAICNILYHTGQLSQPFVPRLLDIAMNGISTQNSNLTRISAVLLSYLFKIFGLNLIDSASDVISSLIDSLVTQNNISTLFYIFHSLNTIFNLGSNSENSAEIYRAIGEILLPRREELMNISTNLIPLFGNFVKDNREDACSLFCELLELFISIMKVYEFEKTHNPQMISSLLPSEFIVFYMDSFIEIIQKGNENNLFDTEIGLTFCDYISQIFTTFGSSYQMNVKIHKPSFNYYFKKSLSSESPELGKTAYYIKERIYDKA